MAFEVFQKIFELWEFEFKSAVEIYFKTMPDKYLRKSMRGVNMTLQKCQMKNLAKKFEFKFDFYLGFLENVFLRFEFCP